MSLTIYLSHVPLGSGIEEQNGRALIVYIGQWNIFVCFFAILRKKITTFETLL